MNQKETKPIRKRTKAFFKTSKVKKWLTGKDVYMGYRFKKSKIIINDNGTTSVFQPYIKKEDETNHEFSLIYDDWKEIVDCYWDIVVDHLIEGSKYKFPRNMGHLEMCKIKPMRHIIRGNKKFMNLNTLGYKPKLIWIKNYEKNFATKFWFIFNISRNKQWSKMRKKLLEDPSIIFSYNGLGKNIE